MNCFEEVIILLIPVKFAAARIVHPLVTAPPMEITCTQFTRLNTRTVLEDFVVYKASLK